MDESVAKSQTKSSGLLIAIMLVSGVWAVGLGAHTYWYAGTITLLLAIHLVTGFQLTGRPTIVTETLLFLPFAAWYHYAPRKTFSGFTQVDILFLFGFYVVAIGTHHLLSLRGGGSRHQAFATAIIAMTLAGTAPQPVPLFLPLLLIFMFAVLLELRFSQGLLDWRPTRGQWARYGLALALLVSLTAVIQYLDVVQLPAFNRWFNQKMLTGFTHESGGVSASIHIGSISAAWEQANRREIVLRDWSDRPAGYLRDSVYEYYDQGAWRAERELKDLRSQTDDHGRMFFNMLPNGSPAVPAESPAGMIYCSAELAENFCLPLGAVRLSSFGDRLLYTEAFTAQSPTRQAAGGYAYYPPAGDLSTPVPDDLEVPLVIRPALRQLASQLVGQTFTPEKFPGKTGRPAPHAKSVSPELAALKIELYFRENFKYRLGQRLSRRKDPVLEFLEDVKAGHCEYFASAGTLLLRTMGIPARYVTGYLCDEPGPGRKYVVARGKDAHAWVEYFTKGRGWQTFDPTPPDDRPEAVHPNGPDLLKERIGAWWQRIWAVAAYGGAFAVFEIVWSALLDLLGWVPPVAWLIVIVAGSAWVFRVRLRSLFGGGSRQLETQRVRDLRHKLHRAEKMLARHGLTRAPSMTVGAFIRAAADAPLPATNKEPALTLLREYQAERFRRESRRE